MIRNYMNGSSLETAMNRRNAIKTLGSISVSAMFGFSSSRNASAGSVSKRPNIIFLLTDDHRWDHLGCTGHPFIKTPRLDRLAAQGVLFENAFVTTSLCSPSRASFLTGQYAHDHGVKNNLTPWRDANVTFLEHLKGAGYHTGYIGKWHMPGKLPKLRGVDTFTTFTVREGQGQYWDCPLIVDGVETTPNKRYITEELTDRALAYIDQQHASPFCLYLSFKAAHHDWQPPDEMADLYREEKSPLAEEADPWVTMTNGGVWAGTVGPLEHHYKNYCRVITSVDKQIGRVLKKLDDRGLADDTIVVYAGDNGYLWGEHRMVDKRWAYEESIRIPFIVKAPGLIPDPGRRADQMVLNIDLAPTILEAAGLPIPATMNGQSMLPILKSRDATGRKAWLYEYFTDFPYNTPEIRAVRTESFIYIEYEGKRRSELYNVKTDPKEKQNLAAAIHGTKIEKELQTMMSVLLEKGRI